MMMMMMMIIIMTMVTVMMAVMVMLMQVDRSIVEAFAMGGRAAVTMRHYPSPGNRTVCAYLI
jgi:hypothetical protein